MSYYIRAFFFSLAIAALAVGGGFIDNAHAKGTVVSTVHR